MQTFLLLQNINYYLIFNIIRCVVVVVVVNVANKFIYLFFCCIFTLLCWLYGTLLKWNWKFFQWVKWFYANFLMSPKLCKKQFNIIFLLFLREVCFSFLLTTNKRIQISCLRLCLFKAISPALTYTTDDQLQQLKKVLLVFSRITTYYYYISLRKK